MTTQVAEKEQHRTESVDTKEPRENGSVQTLREAMILIYRSLLLPHYEDDADRLNEALANTTYIDLLKQYGIKGEWMTFILDLDGVFNDNRFFQSILTLKLEDDALDILREFSDVLHRANIIILTSRPHSWNGNKWEEKVYSALGVQDGEVLQLTRNNLEALVQVCSTYRENLSPQRIVMTDAGKNWPERIALDASIGGRSRIQRVWDSVRNVEAGAFLHECRMLMSDMHREFIIRAKPFFEDALEMIADTFTNITVIDSGNYSKSKIFQHIPSVQRYLSVENKVYWDKLVILLERIRNIREPLLSITGSIISHL